MYEKAGIIINRLPDEKVKDYIDLGNLELLACIGQDPLLAEYDIKGENVFYLPDDSEMVKGVQKALGQLLTEEE